MRIPTRLIPVIQAPSSGHLPRRRSQQTVNSYPASEQNSLLLITCVVTTGTPKIEQGPMPPRLHAKPGLVLAASSTSTASARFHPRIRRPHDIFTHTLLPNPTVLRATRNSNRQMHTMASSMYGRALGTAWAGHRTALTAFHAPLSPLSTPFRAFKPAEYATYSSSKRRKPKRTLWRQSRPRLPGPWRASPQTPSA